MDVLPTMNTPPRRTRPYARQRSDHAQENAEDYVELISDLLREVGAAHKSDMAERRGVSHVTVHKTIKRLKTLGLVNAESYRAVSLTEEGEALAEEVRARHELVLRFLRNLGVAAETAEIDAEGIEHHVSEETLSRMQAFCESMEKDGTFTRPARKSNK